MHLFKLEIWFEELVYATYICSATRMVLKVGA